MYNLHTKMFSTSLLFVRRKVRAKHGYNNMTTYFEEMKNVIDINLLTFSKINLVLIWTSL